MFEIIKQIKGLFNIEVNSLRTYKNSLPINALLGTSGKFSVSFSVCKEEPGSIVVSMSNTKKKMLLEKGDLFNLQINLKGADHE
jgi:hypothetical protein